MDESQVHMTEINGRQSPIVWPENKQLQQPNITKKRPTVTNIIMQSPAAGMHFGP